MAESYSISFKATYNQTDFTRNYEILNVAEEAAAINTVRNKVTAINASLAGGQASTLANLFVSDDYDSQEGVGTLKELTDLKIKYVNEVDIPQISTRKIYFDPDAIIAENDSDPGEISEKNFDEPLDENSEEKV